MFFVVASQDLQFDSQAGGAACLFTTCLGVIEVESRHCNVTLVAASCLSVLMMLRQYPSQIRYVYEDESNHVLEVSWNRDCGIEQAPEEND